jgi:hypothetical protein
MLRNSPPMASSAMQLKNDRDQMVELEEFARVPTLTENQVYMQSSGRFQHLCALLVAALSRIHLPATDINCDNIAVMAMQIVRHVHAVAALQLNEINPAQYDPTTKNSSLPP